MEDQQNINSQDSEQTVRASETSDTCEERKEEKSIDSIENNTIGDDPMFRSSSSGSDDTSGSFSSYSEEVTKTSKCSPETTKDRTTRRKLKKYGFRTRRRLIHLNEAANLEMIMQKLAELKEENAMLKEIHARLRQLVLKMEKFVLE